MSKVLFSGEKGSKVHYIGPFVSSTFSRGFVVRADLVPGEFFRAGGPDGVYLSPNEPTSGGRSGYYVLFPMESEKYPRYNVRFFGNKDGLKEERKLALEGARSWASSAKTATVTAWHKRGFSLADVLKYQRS